MKNKRLLLLPATIAASFVLLAPAVHADAITWDGGGADKNWSTVANWSDDAAATGDDVTFNATGALASGITNTVSASESIASLSYNFEDALNQHTTSIAAAQTLTVAGNFSVLNVTAPTAPTNVSITGSTGTLDVTGTSFLLGNPTATTVGSFATSVDMSGLGTLTANLSGTFRVGGGGSSGNNFAYPVTLKLPAASTITAATVGVSDFSNFATLQKMLLGSGATTINTDNLRVGNSSAGRSGGELSFNTATGTLLLRGLAGGITPVTTMNMVNASSATATNLISTVNLAGHSVDAKITTLNMARRTGTGTATTVATAALTFNQGTLEVGTANMARNGNAALDGAIAATINIGGGTASFGAINMSDNATGNIVKTTTATLNLTGGTTTVTGDIVKLGTTNAVASVVLNGGTLDMDAGNIGSSTNPVTLSLLSGVLKNLGEINGGDIVAGLISKTTAGSVILSGTINYSGGSSVTGGALVFRDTTAKPATGTHAFSADTTLGLGVATSGAPFFTSADVDNAFSGTMTGDLSNVTVTATTNVGIDTTAGDFTYAVPGSPTKGLSKFGINTLTLTGANNYTGPTIIDEGTLAFATTPSLTGSLTFGTTAANATAGTLDLTTANATFSGAMLVNTNSTTANEIKIGPTQILTINNNVQIGVTAPTIGSTSNLTMTGGGTFNVATAAAGSFLVAGATGTTSTQFATLDLTALKATTINTSTTGTLRVGPSTNNFNGRGTLLLPTPAVADTLATTTLTAATIAVGNGNSGGGSMNNITLGTGLTKLNADTINVGTGGRDVGQIIYGQAAGDVIIRAADGTSRATVINVASLSGNTANTQTSSVDLSGHDADILVTALNVGNQPRANNMSTTFNFGQGDSSLASKLDVTSVNIGLRPQNTNTTNATHTARVNLSGGTVTFGDGTGTGVDIGNSAYFGSGSSNGGTVGELNISGGNVIISNSASLAAAVRLGTNTTTGSNATVTASMNLSGGITTLGGDIIRNATSPRTTSTVKISGGTLNMGGKKIGTSLTEPITLTAESGTLQNVESINVSGGLTKTTAGTLTVSGINTYTGDTTVSDGTLALGANNALPATPVSIGSATLDAATFDDTLDTLDAAGSAVINLGAGANLVFADSSAIDWTGGTLNITGTFVSGSSLKFGSSAGGLLVGQLALISVNGAGAGTYTLDTNGFLIATAVTNNYASWANDPTKGNIPGEPATGDFDNDGITNIVEYALGKNPRVSSQPAGVLAGNIITYTKGADAIANGDVSWVIETSQTLAGGSWTAQVTQPAADPALTIAYTLTPSTPVKNFARLKVTQAP